MKAVQWLALLAMLHGAASAGAADDYPQFNDGRLQQGRAVWLDTCQACHTSDFAGAPHINDRASWSKRVEQGADVLYAHALNGFHGPMGTEMPPRGGNPKLTDEEVKAAVDYMVRVATGRE